MIVSMSAAEGTLQSGDIILELDGKAVPSAEALTRGIERKRPDQVALLRVQRDKRRIFAACRIR